MSLFFHLLTWAGKCNSAAAHQDRKGQVANETWREIELFNVCNAVEIHDALDPVGPQQNQVLFVHAELLTSRWSDDDAESFTNDIFPL